MTSETLGAGVVQDVPRVKENFPEELGLGRRDGQLSSMGILAFLTTVGLLHWFFTDGEVTRDGVLKVLFLYGISALLGFYAWRMKTALQAVWRGVLPLLPSQEGGGEPDALKMLLELAAAHSTPLTGDARADPMAKRFSFFIMNCKMAEVVLRAAMKFRFEMVFYRRERLVPLVLGRLQSDPEYHRLLEQYRHFEALLGPVSAKT